MSAMVEERGENGMGRRDTSLYKVKESKSGDTLISAESTFLLSSKIRIFVLYMVFPSPHLTVKRTYMSCILSVSFIANQ